MQVVAVQVSVVALETFDVGKGVVVDAIVVLMQPFGSLLTGLSTSLPVGCSCSLTLLPHRDCEMGLQLV